MVFHCISCGSRKSIFCSEDDLDQDDLNNTNDRTAGHEPCSTSLTVWRKSLVFSCQGFTVIGSDGRLVFRVDNYAGRRRSERLILMDGSGEPLLTMLRRCKNLGLVDTWVAFEGEVGDHSHKEMMIKKPMFCVRKSSDILRANSSSSNVLAYVYRGTCSNKRRYSYVIEGSYRIRSCKVLDESRSVVAEIKKKEAIVAGVSFGPEVFVLMVHPGFDTGFAMALTLILDHMFA